MRCPNCENVIDESSSSQSCPRCGFKLDILSIQQEPRSVDNAPSAHCAIHPDRMAVKICSRCGSFVCEECLVFQSSNEHLCANCVQRHKPSLQLDWEKRRELGFFKAYWLTTKQIMFHPNLTFQQAQFSNNSLKEPLLYAVFSQIVGMSTTMVAYGLFFLIAMLGVISSSRFGVSEVLIGVIIIIFSMLLIPPLTIATIFIHGGIEHLLLKILGAKPKKFSTTVHAYCYSMAPMFWGVIPFCGPYAFPVWQIVCRVYAYKWQHQTTGGKSAAAILIPVAILCSLVMVFYAFVIAMTMLKT